VSPGLAGLVLGPHKAAEVCSVVHRHQVRGVRNRQELALRFLDASPQDALPGRVQRHRGLVQDHEPVQRLGQGLGDDQGLPGPCAGVPFFSSSNRNGSCHAARLRSGDTSASQG
jgi:hypothetical protein